MSLHLHHLYGCRPDPLAHYLKALGILRLLAEQADPQARGWWQDEHFCLLTSLDRDGLETFFLERYAPTPFVSPWNKGSGFYATEDKGLSPIERSVAPRFADFRNGIAAARAPLSGMQEADAVVRALKDRTKAKKGMSASEKETAKALKNDPHFKQELAAAERTFKALKADIFNPCRREWRGPHRSWMDSALVIHDDGDPSFPSLLGTGGNDGRLDFTNNAMQRLAELFDLDIETGSPQPETLPLLNQALWNTPCADYAPKAAIGQFLPGDAGGANSTSGPDGDSLVNAWDYILMLEGTISLQSRLTRQLDSHSQAQASAPFALYAQAAGFSSPGSEKSERGEQWMPLWSNPCTLEEIRRLFGEARLQVGRRPAHRPVDAARAIARLGVARGLNGFTRYGYLERNGQSTLAVSLGRIAVRAHPRAHLIDDLAPWMDRLQREARGKNAANHLIHAERRLSEAVLAALTHDDSPDRWQAILLAAVGVESLQAHGSGIGAGPMPTLQPGWIDAGDDGSTEWRLALAWGSSTDYGEHRIPDPKVRHHWLPINRYGRFVIHEKRLANDPRVVMAGRDLISDACAVLSRRLIEAGQKGQRRLPLSAAARFAARPADLGRFLAGVTDDDRLLALSRAAMALDWWGAKEHPAPTTSSGPGPEDAWWALRLNFLPWPLPEDDRPIPCDPAILRRLTSGDGGAVAQAVQRLSAHGLHPGFSGALLDAATARRWAAALVFPITRRAARRAADTLHPHSIGV